MFQYLRMVMSGLLTSARPGPSAAAGQGVFIAILKSSNSLRYISNLANSLRVVRYVSGM